MMQWKLKAEYAAFVANIALTNIGWLANVLGAAFGRVWIGPCVEVVLLAIHFMLVAPAFRLNRENEAVVVLFAICYGMLIDTFNGAVTHVYPWTFAPVYVISLWANFATCLNVSLSFSHKLPQPYGPAVLGFIFGPMTYISASRMNAIALPAGKGFYRFVLGVGIEWALSLPILVAVATSVSPREPLEPLLDTV